VYVTAPLAKRFAVPYIPDMLTRWLPRRKRAGYDFWCIPATGNYERDCAEGERLASEYVLRMQMHPRPGMLGWIVRDMIAKGRFSGVEVGFFQGLSAHISAKSSRPPAL